MLIAHTFPEPQLNLTLELFLRVVEGYFQGRLVSVVLFGSIVFDDLAPGYGDLDFLAVTEEDLSESVCRQLAELRVPLRSGEYGVYASMIEGAFLPRHMIDPANSGEAAWWGTSGERQWQHNKLGWFSHQCIRDRGIVIWGEDLRHEVPVATREGLLRDVWGVSQSIRQHGRGGGRHSVDWLLSAARALLWLREGRLSSKSEAANWGYGHARGSWRNLLLPSERDPAEPSCG